VEIPVVLVDEAEIARVPIREAQLEATLRQLLEAQRQD
jgi:hypothetical protein